MREKRRPFPDPSGSGAWLLPLTGGHHAIIDPGDAIEVARFNWHARADNRSGMLHAGRTRRRPEGGFETILLHRFLWQQWGIPAVEEIDHRNTNGLDNRRTNLRAADSQRNGQNTGKRANNTAGFKGVSLLKKAQKYRAMIWVNGTNVWLGRFDTAAEAHAAYAKAAERNFGEFANSG